MCCTLQENKGNRQVTLNVISGSIVLEEKKIEQRREAQQIILELRGKGSADNFVYLLAKVRYLVFDQGVTADDGSPLICKEELEEIEVSQYDSIAQYHYRCLEKGHVIGDPEALFREMVLCNRKGSKKISVENVKKARKFLNRERIFVARTILEKAEDGIYGYPSDQHKQIQKFLVYVERYKLSYKKIGVTKEHVLNISNEL